MAKGKKKEKKEAKKGPPEDVDPRLLLKETEGVDCFKFWNKDRYIGNYKATRSDRKIFMNGKGRYVTSDKHIYDGVWEKNDLVEVDEIKFPDKTLYSGGIKKMVLNGMGTYTFYDNERLAGEFVDNRLIGDLFIKDRNDHMWEGVADLENRHVIFVPISPYYTALLDLPPRRKFIEVSGEGE